MIIKIDTSKEATPATLAKELGHKDTTTVSRWVFRKQVKFRRIDELNLTLVDRRSLPGKKEEVGVAAEKKFEAALDKELKKPGVKKVFKKAKEDMIHLGVAVTKVPDKESDFLKKRRAAKSS